MLYAKRMRSPVGELTLVARGDRLAAVLWEKERPGRVRLGEAEADERHPVLLEAERQLGEYFRGERMLFDLLLDPQGTPFQKRVWDALRTIPYGSTRSYRELACAVGSPGAVRAVGASNGRNPLSIIVPCHRVIASDGRLAGFAGGLRAKAWLLEMEKGNAAAASGSE